MFRFYPVIIIIQLFCLYHASTNKHDQKWFWIILFFPGIGSLIYLYYHFYNRKNIEGLKEGLKHSLITNYAIDKLEKQAEFSPTYSNKLELAKEHLKVGNNEKAVEILETFDSSSFHNDYTRLQHLLIGYFQLENYYKVIEIGDQLIQIKEFNNSDEMVAYAWAYFLTGKDDKANELFEKLDAKYCNYEQRLEYAHFLFECDRKLDAQKKIDELLLEISAMDSYEKRLNKTAIRDIKAYSRKIK